MLRLITKFLFAIGIIVGMASCLENDIEEQPARTLNDELTELSVYLDTLTNRGLDIDTTAMGVYYVMDSEGEGAFPQAGDTCDVKYRGFFMNGTTFDASHYHNPDSIFSFVLEETQMIEGWDDGMQVLNEGAKAYLIIPSEFAYGSSGTYGIQPYETLIFEVDMVDIKQAY